MREPRKVDQWCNNVEPNIGATSVHVTNDRKQKKHRRGTHTHTPHLRKALRKLYAKDSDPLQPVSKAKGVVFEGLSLIHDQKNKST